MNEEWKVDWLVYERRSSDPARNFAINNRLLVDLTILRKTKTTSYLFVDSVEL